MNSSSLMSVLLSGAMAIATLLSSLPARASLSGDDADVAAIKNGNDQVFQRGLASWYGPRHAGKRTASGDRFNPDELTAAHKTLPLGTLITVTNLANGHRLTVRVTDRGPNIRSRILDLSQAAARRLGFMALGVVPVEISLFAPTPSGRMTSSDLPHGKSSVRPNL